MSFGSRPSDPRLQAFREEARTILALSGGVNAVSMGKVRHRGQAVGLSPEEVDALVADLRAGDRAESKNRAKFRDMVRSVLKKTRLKPGDLLTPRLVRKLEQAGSSRFQLSPSDASEVVREQGRESGLRRLSAEAAAETFREQVGAARASGPLTPSRMKALRKFADTLGIDFSQFDSLVQSEVRTALAHPAEIRKANGRFLRAVIGSGVFAVLGFLLAMSFFSSDTTPLEDITETAGPASSGARPSDPADPVQPAKAGHAVKSPAIGQARHVFTTPADKVILDGLASSKEAERIGAMRSLLLRLDRHRETPEQQQALQRLLASVLSADPSSSLVTMMLPDLTGRLGLFSDGLSLSARAVDSGFWSLDTLIEALSEPGLDPSRAALIAKELDSVLGEDAMKALVASEKAKETSGAAHALRSGYARSLYQKLTADAPRDASRPTSAEAEKALFARAGGGLRDDERTALRADWLSKALEASGQTWDQYLDAIAQVLDDGRARDISIILDIYIRTGNTALQQALEQELHKRLDDSTGLVTPSEVAEAFRLRSRSGGSRRAAFEERAEAALERAREDKGPAETMRQVVDLALASTLACALEQGETAYPEFDSLLKGPPKVDPPEGAPAPAAPSAPRPATFFRGPAPVVPGGGLDQTVARLSSDSAFERVAACESLARQTLPDDLSDRQASAIALYVLWGGKNGREDVAANTALVPLTRPVSVRLAMADILGDVRSVPRKYRLVGPTAAERMLISITGEPVNLDASEWKTQARRILLYLVLTDLDPGLDSAAGQYRLLYQTQGRLLGMPESDALLTARPSQMVEVVTNHLLSSLSKSRDRLSGPDRERLGRVSRYLSTADYLASGEPQRLVLVQRAWLKALSLYVSSRRPESARQARDLADGLTDDEAHGHDVLEQLRDGEQRALELWRLLIQAKK